MVVLGATALDPYDEIVPILGVIVTDVAPVTYHSSVDGWPAVTVVGLAVKLVITGASGETATFTVTEAVFVPVALVAVSV